LIDINIKILIQKLQYFTKTGEIFDLKMTISHFVLDILGQVAFSQSFDSQSLDKYITHIPAINDHLLLSCVIGELPLQSVTKLLVRWSPIGWMRRLVKSRNVLKAICASCVRKKIENPEGQRDLLKSLVTARDPETGDGLSEQEINSEAFAMLYDVLPGQV
jgi:benzoate 4-monooxygenase